MPMRVMIEARDKRHAGGERETMAPYQVSHAPTWALEDLREEIDRELQDRKRIKMLFREGAW